MNTVDAIVFVRWSVGRWTVWAKKSRVDDRPKHELNIICNMNTLIIHIPIFSVLCELFHSAKKQFRYFFPCIVRGSSIFI